MWRELSATPETTSLMPETTYGLDLAVNWSNLHPLVYNTLVFIGTLIFNS
jgi:hypothetical protein